MMLASSAIAASALSGDYLRAFGGVSLPSHTFLQSAPASIDAEAVTGLAKLRQRELENRSDAVVVIADARQEAVT